jgi:hypothetical protein
VGKYKHFVGLGVAGNFALHLDQAGEAEDFKDIVTKDEYAPKGIFPFYLPRMINEVSKAQLHANKTLNTYPLSSDTLRLPEDSELKIQAEPEVALICDLSYKAGKLSKITPKYFAAYNDCSIRVKGASKISQKKNWGSDSKGISTTLLPIDKFTKGAKMDDFSICSFLKRDGQIHPYGEDTELTGYSYFHEKLLSWILQQINTQEDTGPLEPICEYLSACEYPKELLISIGATRYTEYGETTFLQQGDLSIVIVYDHTKYNAQDIKDMIENNSYDHKNMSVLVQTLRAHG